MACLRGPNLAQNERRVDALLKSTRFLCNPAQSEQLSEGPGRTGPWSKWRAPEVSKPSPDADIARHPLTVVSPRTRRVRTCHSNSMPCRPAPPPTTSPERISGSVLSSRDTRTVRWARMFLLVAAGAAVALSGKLWASAFRPDSYSCTAASAGPRSGSGSAFDRPTRHRAGSPPAGHPVRAGWRSHWAGRAAVRAPREPVSGASSATNTEPPSQPSQLVSSVPAEEQAGSQPAHPAHGQKSPPSRGQKPPPHNRPGTTPATTPALPRPPSRRLRLRLHRRRPLRRLCSPPLLTTQHAARQRLRRQKPHPHRSSWACQSSRAEMSQWAFLPSQRA